MNSGPAARFAARSRQPAAQEPRHVPSPDHLRHAPRRLRRPLPRRRGGFSILEAGGNAIDAGCAAGIALGVLQPDLVNVAGVAPIIIRLADGTVESIAGLGWWPKAIPADLFMREHGGKIPDGVLRTVVPAAPDAWITALRRHGTMRFADVAAPAIRFAAEGFAVYPLLAASIASHEHEYRRWQSNTAIFLPHNRVPRVGRKIRAGRPARTLQFMADQDRAAGPDRARRPERRARRLLPRRHRARDREVPAAGRRLPVDGRPGRRIARRSSRWCAGAGAATS